MQAKAAQASGSFAVTIKQGDPSRSIRLDGAAKAPRVRVTAPNGQVLDSPAGEEPALTPALRVLTSDELKTTIVGLFEPKPGTYKIDLLPGSPAITKVTESEDPGPARVTARVSGRGTQRTLTYDVERRPDQKVTFVEVAAGGKRPLGTVTGGKGTLTFSPAPGTDTRRIEAQFELLGIGAETTTVATFRPPSQRLGRPVAGDGQSALGYAARRLHTRRRSGALRDRDHARDRWAAHHQHPSHRGHDHPRRPRQRRHGDRPRGRADARRAQDGPPVSAPRRRPRRRVSGPCRDLA